ncbi:MAG: FHA domain-containing protein [Burkholderiales bacterium]|nr:FHA domain-containing protein [Burkholderiales bacterium]
MPRPSSADSLRRHTPHHEHARIFWSGSSWMLEDLNSSNGTFIGEYQTSRKLSGPAAIKAGDIFRVGLTRLRMGSVKNERLATAAAVATATRS